MLTTYVAESNVSAIDPSESNTTLPVASALEDALRHRYSVTAEDFESALANLQTSNDLIHLRELMFQASYQYAAEAGASLQTLMAMNDQMQYAINNAHLSLMGVSSLDGMC